MININVVYGRKCRGIKIFVDDYRLINKIMKYLYNVYYVKVLFGNFVY